MNDTEELLSITQITKEMGVHEKTVRRWIEDQVLPLPAEKNVSGHYRVKRSDLNKFIARRKEKYNKASKQQ
jgi:excisionase family DNA binding protein